MKALFHLAKEIQDVLLTENWHFCFIGGIALQRWGEPRLTLDVDLSLLTGFGNEDYFVDKLCSRFSSRIENAEEFAFQNRVLLLKSDRNIPIDIALAGLPFEEDAIERATDFLFLKSLSLKTCSVEDLIIYKAFADRRKDWADVESILMRQNNKIDIEYINKHLIPLVELKENPQILTTLKEIQSQFKEE